MCKETLTSAELWASEIIWLKENQKKIDEKRLRIFTKNLNLIYLIYDDDNSMQRQVKKRPTASWN